MELKYPVNIFDFLERGNLLTVSLSLPLPLTLVSLTMSNSKLFANLVMKLYVTNLSIFSPIR